MTLSPTQKFLDSSGANVIERIDLPPRPERHLPAPGLYREGAMRGWLKSMTGTDRVYRHQALALERVAGGEDVVLATGTASGKSLVFQAALVEMLLNSDRRALVLFPQKALGADQLYRLELALERAGLPASLIGAINGEVSMADRETVMNEARVILATPDVVHSWMMRCVSAPSIQQFLARLGLIVIDEAHVFEGMFGSSSAFLLRRLLAAHQRLGNPAAQPVQFIAATATISEPAVHLKKLVGRDFHVIGEDENGAPFRGLTLLHIEGSGHGGAAETYAADVGRKVAEVVAPDAFIVFHDGRQGVERITNSIGHDAVLPYRSGYADNDRYRIETALRAGETRGIIATSALELGIDIPQFTVGMNVGIPQTRKALRQRVGRIGRSAPGVFAVIAPPLAFAQLGSSFAEFCEGAAEPSHLYLENEFIQFQQARCLLEEDPDAIATVGSGDGWPTGFAAMLQAALPGGRRSSELDQVAQLGADSPHLGYPLRNISEVTYALKSRRDPNHVIGKIEIEKALREAYPGATYYHLKRPHRVVEWRATSYEQSIILEPLKDAARTQPMLRTFLSVSNEAQDVIEQRYIDGPSGSLSEVSMRVCDSVEGYRLGSTGMPYRELGLKDKRMRRRFREFTTTGVFLRINEPWFKGQGEAAVKSREAVVEALRAVLAREHNIAPAELRCVHQNIRLYAQGVAQVIDDGIAIFDNVVGGLRLSAPLFDDFPGVVGRLGRAACLAGEDALLDENTVDRLSAWYRGLGERATAVSKGPPMGPGEYLVFAPQSEVSVRIGKDIAERTLLEPQLVALNDAEVLMYRCESVPGSTTLVSHDRVCPTGGNWRQAIWCSRTNVLREIAA